MSVPLVDLLLVVIVPALLVGVWLASKELTPGDDADLLIFGVGTVIVLLAALDQASDGLISIIAGFAIQRVRLVLLLIGGIVALAIVYDRWIEGTNISFRR